MRQSILLAGSDADVCNTLSECIRVHEPDCTIVGTAFSGAELQRLLEASVPDLVLIRPAFNDVDGYALMRDARERFASTVRFLVYGERDFDAIYRAVKSGATDYLPLPISPKELHEALDGVAKSGGPLAGDNASRRFYITDRSIDSLKGRTMTVDQLNLTYGTHFSDGCFQMLFIKFDFPNSFERLNDNNTPIFHQISEYFRRSYKGECSDIIFEQKNDGLMILLNYPEPQRGALDRKNLELYDRINTMVKAFKRLDLTVCISEVVTNPCEVYSIKQQVRDAEWSRMRYGLNRLSFWSRASIANQALVESRLHPLELEVKLAIESLNIAKFRKLMNEFYALPPSMLITRFARSFVRQMMSHLFQIYWDTIAEFSDPVTEYDDLSYGLHLCTTFHRHQITMISCCSELMQKIAAQADKQYSDAVVRAMAIVKNNIDRNYLLKDIADEVHLSSGYFSHLFKQETGQNFTRYVNECKLGVACELLKSSNLNISEIAEHIGISDVRAFSKKFHAINGTSPSKYKQLHRAKGASSL